MATSGYNKPPQSLSNCKSYEDWVKLITVWKTLTSLESSKQASALLLSLEGKAQNAALEISTDDLTNDDGVSKIIERLDRIYKKNDLAQKNTVH